MACVLTSLPRKAYPSGSWLHASDCYINRNGTWVIADGRKRVPGGLRGRVVYWGSLCPARGQQGSVPEAGVSLIAHAPLCRGPHPPSLPFTNSLFSPQVPARQRHLHPPRGHLRRRDLPVSPVSNSSPHSRGLFGFKQNLDSNKDLTSRDLIRTCCFYPGTIQNLVCDLQCSPSQPLSHRGSHQPQQRENSSSQAIVEVVMTIYWLLSNLPA